MREKIITSIISLYDIENNAVRGIAPVLRENGFRVFEIYFKNWVNNRIDWPRENEINDLINILRDTDTALVAISLRASAYFELAKVVTERIRESLDIPIVWGGLHPTLVPDECIEAADILCIGEGEYPMLELITNISEDRPIDTISNLWIRTEGGVRKNPIRSLIENLDGLPFLDYANEDKYYLEDGSTFKGDPLLKRPLFRIMASRGCIFECSYCYNSILKKIYHGKGRYFRYRSVENVIEELCRVKKIFKKLKYIRFDDEMFIFDSRWIREFSQKYKKKIDLPFECFLYPGNYHEALLAGLKQAGLKVVYMGIEGPERTNKILYNRGFSGEGVLKNAKIFHKLGLDTRYQIILDDPVSTEEDKRTFFEFLMSLPRPFELYLFSLTLFPKTELSERLLAEGVVTNDDIEGRATKTFSQLRVDLNFFRSEQDRFWISLIVLISKSFVPKRLIYRFSRSKFLYTHPLPLVIFSQVCNGLKMAYVLYRMLLRGEVTRDQTKQWLNPKSLISQ